MVLYKTRITKVLIRLRGCAGWSAPVLFANPRIQVFSRRGPNLVDSFDHIPSAYQHYLSYFLKHLTCTGIRGTSRWRRYITFQTKSSNAVRTNRVKTDNFGHQVNSDIHLQTLDIHMRRLRLIRIFIVCLDN